MKTIEQFKKNVEGEEWAMKILVLAGGFDQIALIRALKARGNTVYLVDYLENPPAGQYADRHFKVSTLDEEAVFKLAREQKVDLLTTACTDQALMTVADVSEKLGLPCYLSSDIARNVTNKAFMKKKFSENNIPTAGWTLLENEHDIQVQKKIQYPVIVKPCDCNSSKGVVIAENSEKMMDAIKNAFSLSRSKKVIVEEYKEGREVSIDVWKDREGAKVLSVSETKKIRENEENFTIYQSKYPVDLSDVLATKIEQTAEKICSVFGLENCPVLIQAIIHEDELSVIEFSARMGGGSKYKLIEYMSGIDIMDAYVNRILGDKEQILTPIRSDKKIELDYVYAYNGIFSRLSGFDDFVKSGEIKELFRYKPEGSRIQKRTTSSDRVAGFLIEAATQEELLRYRRMIVDHTDVLDLQGKSMMYKKCFY